MLTENEEALYKAEQFSKQLLQKDVSPDEIVQIHIESLKSLYPELPKEMKRSLDFLLETMIAYGIVHQEARDLREKQLELKSEIEVAANMQDTLLNTVIPDVEVLDIGVLSVAAKQMNGDYHHFIKDSSGNVGVGIADVIGKGIPAALCMSMIKYALDSFSDERFSPNSILELLNRVVERNVEAGMFITMFYGVYDIHSHEFTYSSAGHEPGFFYKAKSKQFEEIDARGIVLGVQNNVSYINYSKSLEVGDTVLLLTDGVTECRQGDRFIERQEVVDVVQKYIHLPAQHIVENVYRYFERLQDFDLRDDFTLIILRRER